MERIEYLWRQYIGKKASEKELDELFALIADPANADLITRMVEAAGNHEQPLQNYDPAQWQWLVDRALGRSLDDQSVPQIKKTIPFIRRWTRIAAAAAVILIASGTYLYFRQPTINGQRSTVIDQKSSVIDIAPGTSKAILTLSNGSKVILDSAHNGSIAIQGNANIIKTDSGKLSYTVIGQRSTPAPQNAGVNDPRSSVNGQRSSISNNTLTTPRGGQYQVTLPDGTKVWLNAASSITYPTAFTTNTRNVLVTGEIYFEVAHDKTKPFKVSILPTANRQLPTTVEVLGTHFNINAYSDRSSINTTLLEGSVRIVNQKQTGILKPGQQAQVNGDIKIVDEVNLEEVMAWRLGKMVLSGGTVQEVMTEISRWYDVDVEYAGAVPNKQFYGSIRRDVPLSTVLHALEAYGVQTKTEGKKIIVQ